MEQLSVNLADKVKLKLFKVGKKFYFKKKFMETRQLYCIVAESSKKFDGVAQRITQIESQHNENCVTLFKQKSHIGLDKCLQTQLNLFYAWSILNFKEWDKRPGPGLGRGGGAEEEGEKGINGENHSDDQTILRIQGLMLFVLCVQNIEIVERL